MNADCQYMSKTILRELVGWTIVGSVLSEDHESFGLIVQGADHQFDPTGQRTEPVRKTVWVDCDAEGNGPGWLSIE